MRNHIQERSFPETAIPDLPHISRVAQGTIAETRRLAHEPHHVRIRKSMERAVNVFVRVRLKVVVAVITDPCHRIARENHGGAARKENLKPARHLKTAVGKIAMQVKSGAEAAPKIHEDHDRQISPLEAGQERRHAQDLKANKRKEKEKIEFIVFEHSGLGQCEVDERRHERANGSVDTHPARTLSQGVISELLLTSKDAWSAEFICGRSRIAWPFVKIPHARSGRPC